ncbi:MAG: hypothetical protein Q8928_11505 [Bacteroidota bacterium]|nr:hypothetical protein [Bacteroidota bacterium]
MLLKQITLKPVLFIVFLNFLFNATFAQKAPVKFGKIDKEDLLMKVYPADTSAEAVVLCDYGYFDANQLQFTRTLRIKILKKEGEHWGDQIFPTSSKANIKGITYNLVNNEIVTDKLKSESIFKERVNDDYYRIRVAMPNVKEGSIIDLMFYFPGLPSEWKFQNEIPVKWSELVIEPNQYISFRKNFFGYESLSENSDMRWVAKNMPAFKKEPYMNSIENYITKFEIDILDINIPGYYKSYTTSWEAVNELLLNHEYFGKTLSGTMFLNSTAKEIEKKYTSPIEKMKAAFEAVKKVKWNEEKQIFTTNNLLNTAFNKKIGNSADINLILVQLLKKLDLDAYPVALSTRENGILSPVFPSYNKLNYVIAYTKIGEQPYLLDATEDLMPAGLIPERCVNWRGRIINSNKSEWVDLITDKKQKKITQYELKLEPENILTGKISAVRYDYSAFNFRKKYEKFNGQDEYLKDFEKTHTGLQVQSCKLSNADSIYLPLYENYDVKIKNYVSKSDNLLYINPMAYERITENPFKLEDRKYPVDFTYRTESTHMFKLSLPEGYEVSELPKSVIMRLPDNGASLTYQLSTNGNSVNLTCKLQINKTIFTEADYANLRSFYSEVVKKESESIVLKKI